MLTIGLYGISDIAEARPVYVHDHGIALMRDGKVETVVQLERWSGRKHDNRLPEVIDTLLEEFVPAGEEVRFVSVNSFMGNAFISHSGKIRIEPERQPDIKDILTPATCYWYPDGRTRRHADAWIMCHEFAHLGALLPFVGRFEQGALMVHIDGGAYRSTSSFWVMTERGPELLESSWERLHTVTHLFNSSSVARLILGLKPSDHLSMPGKLMGYAAYGHERPEISRWLIKNNWFLHRELTESELLGLIQQEFGLKYDRIDMKEAFFQDVCASMQAFFTREVTQAILDYKQKLGTDTLYFAGGAALNILTNNILEEHFKNVYIPPLTNDSGLALGAAAWLEYIEKGSIQKDSPFLNRFGIEKRELSIEPYEIEQTARLLNAGKVVGICNGAGEAGPRALGHRSILGRMDDPDLKVRISEKIKRREWYRPLGVFMMKEVAEQVFGKKKANSHLAPFMLTAWKIPEKWRSDFRGVLHKDGTVRVQVVSSEDRENQWIYMLLKKVFEDYNLIGLINTSFNIKGLPIIQYHGDCKDQAISMGLDAVVIEGRLIELNQGE